MSLKAQAFICTNMPLKVISMPQMPAKPWGLGGTECDLWSVSESPSLKQASSIGPEHLFKLQSQF